MFNHYQRRGKCEWFEGGLDEFVSHYNRECGTNYALTECLDIARTGGATEKKPEVLVTDRANGKKMAIERKSVVWPPTYILRHNNEHDFAETIWELTRDWYHDACYELTVSGKQVEVLDNRTIREIARDIGSAIAHLAPSDLPVRRSVPINWDFQRANIHEYGQRRGIVVVHQDSMSFEDFSDDSAKAGTASAMQEELAEASLKFDGYPDVGRVVLLDFYGTDFWEDDIPPLMATVTIPPNIDEIWMTKRDWVSEDDFEIGYERLFMRETCTT